MMRRRRMAVPSLDVVALQPTPMQLCPCKLAPCAPMQRATRELRVVQSLQHEHVPVYLAALLDEPSTVRLVMQYNWPTCTLLEAIRASGGLSEGMVRNLIIQIISILEHLHGQGIVYVVSPSEGRGGRRDSEICGCPQTFVSVFVDAFTCERPFPCYLEHRT